MLDWTILVAEEAFVNVWEAFSALLLPLVFFVAVGYGVKRKRILADARRALPECRTTLILFAFNIIVVVPFIAVFSTWLNETFGHHGIHIVHGSTWSILPAAAVVFAAIFVGDFTGYWRHRLEHTMLLWPSHAVHHSDTAMTWVTLERFHPVNRITTLAIDTTVLLLLGFPPYAVVANNLVRHYYGYFVHADLPWTYGKLGTVLVSPVMHRWHHAADPRAYNTNFATVFSLFDRWFGTFRVPGVCDAELGVSDDMGLGAVGQLIYPFKPRAYRRPIHALVRQAAKLIPITSRTP